MRTRIAIVGVGHTAFRATSPGVSYKELMFEAATKAYADAGLDPRKDVDTFLSCSEDFNEGTSIFDEYVPDQIGGAQRPVYTIGGDALHGLATAFMQIQSGTSRVVAVEAHSKASNMVTPERVHSLAHDPVFIRPLGLHPEFAAGLEADAYFRSTKTTREDCAHVVAKNRRNALSRPWAAFGASLTPEDVLASPPCIEPLSELEISGSADGGTMIVLASEDAARGLAGKPIWIRGIGWASGSYSLSSRRWGEAEYVRLSAAKAYAMAGISDPRQELDFAEVDDTYSYKELQHLEALGFFEPGEAGKATREGATQPEGRFPVNASGGSLGCGNVFEATGLHRAAEVALQLRGEAGTHQIDGVRVGIAQSWRFVPSATGAVAVLGVGR